MKNFLISYARRIGRYLLFLFLAFVLERTAFLLVNFPPQQKVPSQRFSPPISTLSIWTFPLRAICLYCR